MDHMLHTRKIRCPNCGELVEILVNPDDDGDTYIEDCSVCCGPMDVSVTLDDNDRVQVQVRHDDSEYDN